MTLKLHNSIPKDPYTKQLCDVDAEKRVDDSLIKILKLRFGRDFEACFWSRY